MGTIKPWALLLCAVHQKTWYATQGLAEAAMRNLPAGAGDVMSAYPCAAATTEGMWHYGTDRELVEAASAKAQLVYTTATGQPAPLTFTPSPLDVRPLNGKAGVPVVDNGIESLLAAAELSGVAEAERLAKEIRRLVAELVREVRIGQQERDLQAQIAELEAKRDAAITALRELRGEPAPTEKPASRAANLPPSGDQAAIRAWAREETAKGVEGLEVKSFGAIPVRVREAYERAMEGGA